MNVALMGSVSSSAAVLRGLIAGDVEVGGVLGLDPELTARISDGCDLQPLAQAAGVPFLPFRKVSEPAVREFLTARRPDLLFVIGLSQLVPDSLIALASSGGVGFHPTPLPRGRGRAPVAWTILLEQPAAANLFFLSAEADAGDIIAQRAVETRPDDYAQDLIDRTNVVLEAMTRELAPTIRAGRLPRVPQDHSQASWYGKRTPEDGRIDWKEPATSVYRLIRACSRPYPGAFSDLGGRRLLIWRAQPHDQDDHHGTLGQILRTDERRGALAQCGQGLLWLTELTDADGAAVPASSLPVGARLGV